MILDLDMAQMEQLQEALIKAFPRYADLKLMLMNKLGENIETITTANSLTVCVFEIVERYKSRDKVDELVHAALKANNSNMQLQSFARSIHLVTADVSGLLPPLDLSAFEAPRKQQRRTNEILNSDQIQMKIRQEKYYREEFFISPADAKKFGVTHEQFALLAISQLTPGKAEQQYAFRFLVDQQVKPGELQCNRYFFADRGLRVQGGPGWVILRADHIIPVSEATFELVVERSNLKDEIKYLQRERRDIFLNRSLFVEKGTTLQSLSLRVEGMGYFNMHSLKPNIATITKESILVFNDLTKLQLFVPHRKGGVDMVIVVDASGSMDIPDYVDARNKRLTRLEGVGAALEVLMQKRLLAGNRVSRMAMIVFGNNTSMLYPSAKKAMVELNDEQQIKDIRMHLRSKLTKPGLTDLQVDRRYTNISRALDDAAELLQYCCPEEGNEKVLLLLSDGADWAEASDQQWFGEIVSSTEDPAILADNLHDRRGLRIHTIAISSEQAYRKYVEPAGEHKQNIPNTPLLREIARLTKAIFFESPNAKDLEKLFEEIGQGTIYPLT